VVRRALLAALVAAALAAAGCARVRPWQRETLSAPELRAPRWRATQRAEVHVFEIREGTQGAYGSAGGGCGCN
jgi:hypothetical protein